MEYQVHPGVHGIADFLDEINAMLPVGSLRAGTGTTSLMGEQHCRPCRPPVGRRLPVRTSPEPGRALRAVRSHPRHQRGRIRRHDHDGHRLPRPHIHAHTPPPLRRASDPVPPRNTESANVATLPFVGVHTRSPTTSGVPSACNSSGRGRSSRIPSVKSAAAEKPSRVRARSGLAKTWRTSPARQPPTTSGRGASGPNASAIAVGHVEQPARRAARDVERTGHAGRGAREHVRARRRRATWTKSRSWPPSSKTRGARPVRQRVGEDRRDPRVRRVARHPRSVDVVVPQRGHDDGRVLACERRGQVLLRDLRRGVDVARVEPRRLGNGLGREARAALRARRLEPAGVEIGRRRAGPARRRRRCAQR